MANKRSKVTSHQKQTNNASEKPLDSIETLLAMPRSEFSENQLARNSICNSTNIPFHIPLYVHEIYPLLCLFQFQLNAGFRIIHYSSTIAGYFLLLTIISYYKPLFTHILKGMEQYHARAYIMDVWIYPSQMDSFLYTYSGYISHYSDIHNISSCKSIIYHF